MTGMDQSLRLGEMLCARLCHDLSGPLGALIGVLELAREKQPDNEALALAEDTAVELAHRLKLLRAAWGNGDEEMDVPRLREFVDTLSSSRRVRVDLGGLAPQAVFPGPAARIILNLVLLAAESLPAGGVVALSGSTDAGILVTMCGPKAAWPAGFAAWLQDDAAAWEAMRANPRRLQGPLTALLARSFGLRLSILMATGSMSETDISPPLLLSFPNE